MVFSLVLSLVLFFSGFNFLIQTDPTSANSLKEIIDVTSCNVPMDHLSYGHRSASGQSVVSLCCAGSSNMCKWFSTEFASRGCL